MKEKDWNAFNRLIKLGFERRKRRKNIEVTFDDSLKGTAIVLNQAIDELDDEEKRRFLVSLIKVLKVGGHPNLPSLLNKICSLWPLVVIAHH